MEGDSSLLTQLTSIHLPPTSQTWTHWSNSPHHKLLKIFQFYFFNSCERVLFVCQLILQMMLRGNESVKLSPIRRRLMISPSAGMGQAVHCSKPPRLTPPLSSDGSGGRRSRAVTELDRNQQIHELLTSQCRHTGTPTQPAAARDIPAPASRDHPATTRSNINHCSQESNVRNFYLLQKISHRKYLRKIFDSISF